MSQRGPNIFLILRMLASFDLDNATREPNYDCSHTFGGTTLEAADKPCKHITRFSNQTQTCPSSSHICQSSLRVPPKPTTLPRWPGQATQGLTPSWCSPDFTTNTKLPSQTISCGGPVRIPGGFDEQRSALIICPGGPTPSLNTAVGSSKLVHLCLTFSTSYTVGRVC